MRLLCRGLHRRVDQRFLVVSGESRLSHDIHTKVLGALSEGDASAHAALDRLRECAYGMRDALLSEDFDQMAEIMNANWEAQKALCGAITTPRIERIIEIARAAGAAGAKVNGAGGGGTVTILCAPEAKPRVRQALYQVDEVEILPPLTCRRAHLDNALNDPPIAKGSRRISIILSPIHQAPARRTLAMTRSSVTWARVWRPWPFWARGTRFPSCCCI